MGDRFTSWLPRSVSTLGQVVGVAGAAALLRALQLLLSAESPMHAGFMTSVTAYNLSSIVLISGGISIYRLGRELDRRAKGEEPMPWWGFQRRWIPRRQDPLHEYGVPGFYLCFGAVSVYLGLEIWWIVRDEPDLGLGWMVALLLCLAPAMGWFAFRYQRRFRKWKREQEDRS